MSKAETHCVLLANAHHGLSEGVRGLLSATFKAVVMVADEVSLFESAGRLQSDLAVVDLALARGNALDLIRRLCNDFPKMKVIAIGVHDQSSVGRSVWRQARMDMSGNARSQPTCFSPPTPCWMEAICVARRRRRSLLTRPAKVRPSVAKLPPRLICLNASFTEDGILS
jgi:hypothetical protein